MKWGLILIIDMLIIVSVVFYNQQSNVNQSIHQHNLSKSENIISTANKKYSISQSRKEEEISYLKIKHDLSQYCSTCSTPSLDNYKEAITKLEKYVHSHQNSVFYEKSFDDLISGYTKLVFQFNENYKSDTSDNIGKIYSLLIKKAQSETDILQITDFSRNAEKTFKNIDSNYIINNETKILYQAMLNKLFSESKRIRNEKLNGQKLIEYIKNSSRKDNVVLKIDKFQYLLKRIEFSILMPNDFLLLSEYITVIQDYKNHKNLISKKIYKQILIAVSNYISTNQLKYEQLLKIRRAVIIASTQNINNHIFENIIWWSEARNNSNVNSNLEFLDHQMPTLRKNDAIRLFVELGEVERLKKWSRDINFENSEIIFNLAIRQAKIKSHFLNNNVKSIHSLTQEFIKSIDEMISSATFDMPIYQEHIKWLVIQLGVNQNKKEINDFFKNLANDSLFYNNSILSNLDSQRKEEIKTLVKKNLEITSIVKYILNNGIHSINK